MSRDPSFRRQRPRDCRGALAAVTQGTDAVEQLAVVRQLSGAAHGAQQRVPGLVPAGAAALDAGVLGRAGDGHRHALDQQGP